MKRYLTEGIDGSIGIIQIAGDDANGNKLTKTLFELSRTTDTTTHFDAALHTRAAIATGIPGHRPLPLLGECDHTELPDDRHSRDAWEWAGKRIRSPRAS
jgi:hypothetical protein